MPAVAFPYFDPEKVGYLLAKGEPISLHVTGEAAPVAGAPAPNPPAIGENNLALDIRPLRGRSSPRRDPGASLARPEIAIVVAVIPPLLFAGVLVLGAARSRFGSGTEGSRRRERNRRALKRLRAAEHLLARAAIPQALGEIERVLNEALTTKLGRSAMGLGREDLSAALAGLGAAEDLREAIRRLLDETDRARFAPGSIGADEARRVLDRAGEVLARLERHAAEPTREGNP